MVVAIEVEVTLGGGGKVIRGGIGLVVVTEVEFEFESSFIKVTQSSSSSDIFFSTRMEPKLRFWL